VNRMGCAEAVERLWAFLDGGLEEHDERAVEAHLELCLRCCGELAFARMLREVLRDRTAGALPDDVRDRLERFIDDLAEEVPT
jgi:anti-sigma factor (TIGR02949 family)